jgi:predicted permease
MNAEIFSIIAPVLICSAIGFCWAKMRVPFETAFVTRIVTNVGFPCLIFVSLATVDLDSAALGVMGLASLLSVLAFAIIGYVFLRVLGIDRRTFLPSLLFANTGNMGLPLCLLAFGEPGLALGVAYFSINAIINFAFGPAIASGNANPIAILKTPLLWSSLGGVAVKLSGVGLPEWLLNTLTLIGGFPIPLMLITLGVSLAQLKIVRIGHATAISMMRLMMGFSVGWGIGILLDLDPVAHGVLIIECAMPVAVFNFLYAQMYNNKPGEVAGVVLISSILSFVTLPVLLWFILPQ